MPLNAQILTLCVLDLRDDLRLSLYPHVERCVAFISWRAAYLIVFAEQGPIVNANSRDVGELCSECLAEAAAVQASVCARDVKRCDQALLACAAILDPAIKCRYAVKREGIQSVNVSRRFDVNLSTNSW